MRKAGDKQRLRPGLADFGDILADILGKIRSERLPPAAVRLVVTPRRKRRVARNVERDRRREPRGEPVMRSDFEFQRLGYGYVFISSVVSVTRADADMRIAAVIACLSF